MTLSDIGAIIGMAGTGATALKTGTEFLQGAKELLSRKDPDLLALKQLISDVYDELIIAKKAQMAQQDALMELQNQLKKSDAFQAEKARYTLTKTELGGFVYALKPGDNGGEPAHDLCVSCFQDEVKSVLQPVDFNTLGCPRCGSKVLKPDGRSEVRFGRLETGWDVLDPYGRR
jgi:hypothetical protein